jgi:hypothetical protein
MALWTRNVGIFTIVFAAVAVISAGISYYMWREMVSSGEDTKWLIGAAQMSANAAQNATEVAEKTLLAQRADIGVLKFDYVDIINQDKAILGYQFQAKMKNFGATQARNVELTIVSKLINAGTPEKTSHWSVTAPPKELVPQSLEDTNSAQPLPHLGLKPFPPFGKGRNAIACG